MSKKMVALLLTGLLILGIATGAIAAPGSGQSSISGGYRNSYDPNTEDRPPAITRLDLSEEQYAKIRDINAKFFEKIQALRQQMSKKRFELRQLYLQKDPDQNAIKTDQNQLNDLKDKMLKLRQDKLDEMKKVLTKEQQEQLNQLKGSGLGRGSRYGNGRGSGLCNGTGGRGLAGY